MINIISGESIMNHIEEYDVILVGTNCYQSMRNGFQFEISKKYPYVRQYNNLTKYGDISKLGTILECKNESIPLITILFVSFGYNFKGDESEYLDYNALEKCVKLINLIYTDKKIATTIIGSTFFDGNGDKNKIIDIFKKATTHTNITLYDYEQESYDVLKKKEYYKRKSLKIEK